MGSAPSSAKQATFRPQDNTIAVRRANSCADFSMEAELKSDQLTNNKTNNDAKSEYKEMYMELKKHMSALKSAKNFRQFAIEDGKDDFEYIVSAADVDFINDTRLFVAESFIEFGLVPLWQKEWKIYEEVSNHVYARTYIQEHTYTHTHTHTRAHTHTHTHTLTYIYTYVI